MVLGDSYVEMNSEVSDNHRVDFPSNKESAYDFSVTSKHHKYEVWGFHISEDSDCGLLDYDTVRYGYMGTHVLEEHTVSIFKVEITLKVEAACSPEMLQIT